MVLKPQPYWKEMFKLLMWAGEVLFEHDLLLPSCAQEEGEVFLEMIP